MPSLLFILILIILWKRLLNLKSLDIILSIYWFVLLVKLRLVERLLSLKLLQVSLLTLADLRMLGIFNTILNWFFYFFLYFCYVISLLNYLLILCWRFILLLRLTLRLIMLGFSVDFSWTHFDLSFLSSYLKGWHNRVWTLLGKNNDMLSSKADHSDWIFLKHPGFKLVRLVFIFVFSVAKIHVGAESPRIDHHTWGLDSIRIVTRGCNLNNSLSILWLLVGFLFGKLSLIKFFN